MRVFEMNEFDCMIGATLQECTAAYLKSLEDGESDGKVDGARELTDAELDDLIFSESLDDPKSAKRTFRAELENQIQIGGNFPRMFASTEY